MSNITKALKFKDKISKEDFIKIKMWYEDRFKEGNFKQFCNNLNIIVED